MSMLSGIYRLRERATRVAYETPVQWQFTDEKHLDRCIHIEVLVDDIADDAELIRKLGLPDDCRVVSDKTDTYVEDADGVVILDDAVVINSWVRGAEDKDYLADYYGYPERPEGVRVIEPMDQYDNAIAKMETALEILKSLRRNSLISSR